MMTWVLDAGYLEWIIILPLGHVFTCEILISQLPHATRGPIVYFVKGELCAASPEAE